MSLPGIVRDIVIFPVTWFTGADYREAENKARSFLYAAARVAIACSVVWALYQAQHREIFRRLILPTNLVTIHLGRFSFSLEMLSFLINLYFIQKSLNRMPSFGKKIVQRLMDLTPWPYSKIESSEPFKAEEIIAGTYLWGIGSRIGKCLSQIFLLRKLEGPWLFFAASYQWSTVTIDILKHMMMIADKIPESRLGISFFLTAFGSYQLYFYTMERWDLREVPTSLVFHGLFHVIFGLGWLSLYERDHSTEAVKETYLYRVATWPAPYLAWLVTGK